MFTIDARNINDAFILGLAKLRVSGRHEESRNGPVLALQKPLATVYQRPMERVLFEPARDGNPFFHLFESLWMLAGSQDLEFLLQFNKKMADYSDDGVTVRGSAYGYRWQNYHPDMAQLGEIISLLRRDPYTRRAVLAMWDAPEDLGAKSKDIPCNTHIYFRIRTEGLLDVLDMTVCCRSNDMIYGGYGSNVVHFSILQEFLARTLKVHVGTYTQLSNNAHVYTENPVWHRCSTLRTIPSPDLYADGTVHPFPLLQENEYSADFFEDCYLLVDGTHQNHWNTDYFAHVVDPLLRAHQCYKAKEYRECLKFLSLCKADDWTLACSMWLAKRGVTNNV